MPTLLLMRNANVLRMVHLLEGETRIGRALNNHLVFPCGTVSKTHAVLVRQGRFVTLRDLHSTNGTLVNHDAVSVCPLLDGDTIRVADFEMLFLDRDIPDAEVIESPPQERVEEAAETMPAPLPTPNVGADSTGRRIGGPRGAEWVGDGVAFTLTAQGREIPALITSDALASHFGAFVHAADGASRAVTAYEENYVAINVAAWSRYDATHREPILVRSSDF
ncbi:DUF1488 family protein [Variovorax ureilyticus]|uniref:DUF1488 family protein n=1 Tax=Variovorax ureilyticus TaxID=1836198 RepID=A0ABU8VML2_9BURK